MLRRKSFGNEPGGALIVSLRSIVMRGKFIAVQFMFV